MARTTWEGKCLFQFRGFSPSLREVGAHAQARAEAETVEECCLLACWRPHAQLAYSNVTYLPPETTTEHAVNQVRINAGFTLWDIWRQPFLSYDIQVQALESGHLESNPDSADSQVILGILLNLGSHTSALQIWRRYYQHHPPKHRSRQCKALLYCCYETVKEAH